MEVGLLMMQIFKTARIPICMRLREVIWSTSLMETPYADSAIEDLKQFVPYATLDESPSILGSIGIAYAI